MDKSKLRKEYRVNLGSVSYERWSRERKRIDKTNEQFASFLFEKWDELETLKINIGSKRTNYDKTDFSVQTEAPFVPTYRDLDYEPINKLIRLDLSPIAKVLDPNVSVQTGEITTPDSACKISPYVTNKGHFFRNLTPVKMTTPDSASKISPYVNSKRLFQRNSTPCRRKVLFQDRLRSDYSPNSQSSFSQSYLAASASSIHSSPAAKSGDSKMDNVDTDDGQSFISSTGGIISPFPDLQYDDCDFTLPNQTPTSTNCEDSVNERMVIVYLSNLEELIRKAYGNLCFCGAQVVHSKRFQASAVIFQWECSVGRNRKGHKNGSWSTQKIFNGIYGGTLKLASAILLSGNSFAKIFQFCQFAKLQLFSENTFYNYQRFFIYPAVKIFWTKVQDETYKELQGREIIAAGDGRNDSPGHTAQFLTYTIADSQSKKILSLKNVDVREAKGKSSGMELIGFRKATEEVISKAEAHGIRICEIVTDAHSQIIKEMKSPNRHLKEAFHSLDIWHVAKNTHKKIIKASKQKNCSVLAKWAPDIKNHFWYCSKNCDGDVIKLQWMWFSVLNHVTNYHEWATDIFGIGQKCAHDMPLPEEDRDKEWLEVDSPAYLALQKVIKAPYLLRHLVFYTKFRHTGWIESFNNLILKYATKRQSFTWIGYQTRTMLAAIDHNHHAARKQALTKGGKPRYNFFWTRKSDDHRVSVVYEEKNYKYIYELLIQIFEVREKFQGNMAMHCSLDEDDPKRIHPSRGLKDKPLKEELLKKHLNRFEMDAKETDGGDSDETLIYDYDYDSDKTEIMTDYND